MKRIPARSASAEAALDLVEWLQRRFVDGLDALTRRHGGAETLKRVEWLRDEGRHGGGVRYETGDTALLDRGSVNVSQVHYDDLPERRLASATALSTIVHPRNPRAPSIHMHVSWTELRDGGGTWRIMADLNPAIAIDEDRNAFATMLAGVAPEVVGAARRQGDRYFYIPALERHRGVVHFYLEGYATDDPAADLDLARRVGMAGIDFYLRLLDQASTRRYDEEDERAQLRYHTLYLFQVLTLDRGTTSGLLVHDQNDVGVLGSLPSHVDARLLSGWGRRVPPPQDHLVAELVGCLGGEQPALVDERAKRSLADVVRRHYRTHPRALALQASGDVTPPTVQNHA